MCLLQFDHHLAIRTLCHNVSPSILIWIPVLFFVQRHFQEHLLWGFPHNFVDLKCLQYLRWGPVEPDELLPVLTLLNPLGELLDEPMIITEMEVMKFTVLIHMISGGTIMTDWLNFANMWPTPNQTIKLATHDSWWVNQQPQNSSESSHSPMSENTIHQNKYQSVWASLKNESTCSSLKFSLYDRMIAQWHSHGKDTHKPPGANPWNKYCNTKVNSARPDKTKLEQVEQFQTTLCWISAILAYINISFLRLPIIRLSTILAQLRLVARECILLHESVVPNSQAIITSRTLGLVTWAHLWLLGKSVVGPQTHLLRSHRVIGSVFVGANGAHQTAGLCTELILDGHDCVDTPLILVRC